MPPKLWRAHSRRGVTRALPQVRRGRGCGADPIWRAFREPAASPLPGGRGHRLPATRDSRTDWPGRHRGGVSGMPAQARPPSSPQVAGGAGTSRWDLRRTVPSRSPTAGQAQPPGHRRRPRAVVINPGTGCPDRSFASRPTPRGRTPIDPGNWRRPNRAKLFTGSSHALHVLFTFLDQN
jgi:hypothetical protein